MTPTASPQERARLQIQVGSVHQNGVLGLPQGGDGAVGVIVIPLNDVSQDLLERGLFPFLQQLCMAAAGPLLGRGGEVDFHLGVWEHHCADVPAVHDHVIFPGDFALELKEEIPHCGQRRHLGGRHGHFGGADLLGDILSVHQHPLFPVDVFQLSRQLPQPRNHLVLRPEVDALLVHIIPHRPVQRSGVHINIPQVFCQLFGDGALSRACGAVNCNCSH